MIDINKKYRTRDGREVRIYAIDGLDTHSVHGAMYTIGGWLSYTWRKDGSYFSDMDYADDLIEVKPRIKRTVWLALYPLDDVWIVSDDCTAVEKGCLARVKVEIDVEEGEGL